MLSSSRLTTLVLLSLSTSVLAKFSWGQTKYLFTFGDSYTTTGFNISAGVDSPVPGWTSSNGPNWVQYLGDTYNITSNKVFNLASGGATIDAALVPPYLPYPKVLSLVDQVNQFKSILAPKPVGAQWNSSNSLFAIWIGINDIGQSFGWTNISQPADFYGKLMTRLDSQLEILRDSGARNFVLLSVPPLDRAPLFIQQGRSSSTRMKTRVAQYNQLLQGTVSRFKRRHADVDLAAVFDTQPVFNSLLDGSSAFGIVNITGWCEAYQNGTPTRTTQIAPCAPVSSYFWLNSLHPLFFVHDVLAHAISTELSK